jgi:hypothetical protein
MRTKANVTGLSFYEIRLLIYFSNKRNINCLEREEINKAIYSRLRATGLLKVSRSKGFEFYAQTSMSGRILIANSLRTSGLKR